MSIRVRKFTKWTEKMEISTPNEQKKFNVFKKNSLSVLKLTNKMNLIKIYIHLMNWINSLNELENIKLIKDNSFSELL